MCDVAMEAIMWEQYCRKILQGIEEKAGCVLFGGQRFYSSVTSTVLSDSASYQAAILGFMLSCNSICRDTILTPLIVHTLCLHAHVGVRGTYICTCCMSACASDTQP